MRTRLWAAAALLLAACSGCNCLDLHQGLAENKLGAPRICPQCEQAAMLTQQQEKALLAQQQQSWLLAQQQAALLAEQQQMALLAQQQGGAGHEVLLVAYPAPCENCEPSGYGNGPYGGAGGHAGHPGRVFDGGRYGWHGSPHGTPGYPRRHHMHREYVGPQGPPTAQVAYPYYTIRGPRDFLIDNPPSIGR